MISNRSRISAGFTLIELMLVVAILGILASIAAPQFDLFNQKSWQAATKGNLGAIRSALALYYSEMEGQWPMSGYSDGYPPITETLSTILVPRYMEKVPTPKVLDRVGSFNGMGLSYDKEALNWMTQSPPQDVVIYHGPVGPMPFVNRPYVYNPTTGESYLCNNNRGVDGRYLYEY